MPGHGTVSRLADLVGSGAVTVGEVAACDFAPGSRRRRRPASRNYPARPAPGSAIDGLPILGLVSRSYSRSRTGLPAVMRMAFPRCKG